MKIGKRVLAFNQKTGDMWLNMDGKHESVWWGISEVMLDRGTADIFHEDGQMGIIWDIDELKEGDFV